MNFCPSEKLLQLQVVLQFAREKCSILFLYRIREDEAQDASNKLEQEDHSQGDTELGGENETVTTLICFAFIHHKTDSSETH